MRSQPFYQLFYFLDTYGKRGTRVLNLHLWQVMLWAGYGCALSFCILLRDTILLTGTTTFLQARVSTAGKGKRTAHLRREEERKWGATL